MIGLSVVANGHEVTVQLKSAAIVIDWNKAADSSATALMQHFYNQKRHYFNTTN